MINTEGGVISLAKVNRVGATDQARVLLVPARARVTPTLPGLPTQAQKVGQVEAEAHQKRQVSISIQFRRQSTLQRSSCTSLSAS